MSLLVTPWFMPWFVSWLGGGTQVAFPALVDVPTGGLPVHQTISLAPEHALVDAFNEDATISVNFSIANRCVAPDGFPRVAVLAGKQGEEPTLPGPVISGYKGDRFLINVTNDLTDTSMFTGTTIHWHGISQHHSNQMDGTAYVTQCPLSPGKSFLYNFTGEDQVGTFWYHSHYGVQYCDGLRGAFVIRDREDPFKDLYDFDDDSTIITLMDWYHSPSPQQIFPNSVLINGTGCYRPDSENTNCSPSATYMVEMKKRYRFRVLNMACRQYYDFSIDSHNMTVIEVDGEYVEPYTINTIRVHPGQRYSFVLNADQPPSNYWIHAIPRPSRSFNATTTAILRYVDAPTVDPQTVHVATNYLNETLLRSVKEPPARIVEHDPDVRLDVAMNTGDHTFLINGVSYKPPSVPVLLQIMNGALSSEIDPRESVYLLPRDRVVEVVFHVNHTLGHPHPFHLHGHHFAVVKSADAEFRNYDKPVMRDTVSTGIGGKSDSVTIRFITDNPGPWILHCHNEWHFYRGMSIVFVEDYTHVRTEQPLDDATRDLCLQDDPDEALMLLPPAAMATTTATTATCTPMPWMGV